jgi:hypothetical protein
LLLPLPPSTPNDCFLLRHFPYYDETNYDVSAAFPWMRFSVNLAASLIPRWHSNPQLEIQIKFKGN